MMRSVFKIQNAGSTEELTKHMSNGLRTSNINETNESVCNKHGSSNNKEIHLNGILLSIRSEKIVSPLQIDVKHHFPYIKVQFILEGDSNYMPANSKSIPVDMEKGQYNFFYLPEVEGTLTYKQSSRKTLEIIITEEYIRGIFSGNFEKICYRFGEALNTNSPFKLFNTSQPIPAELSLIINDILNCSYQKEIKEVYLESKVKEIFSYLFAIIIQQTTQINTIQLNSKDKKQILIVEEIIKTDLHKTLTIKEIATLTGINQNKLKRNFKLLTGKPIFSYLSELRMEEAKKLLVKEKMNVSEVAYAVGYKNPQHFTNAFKKRFNYLPSEIKKKLQSQSA